MKAKEYLQQIRKCDRIIENKLSEIDSLRGLAESVTSTWKEDAVQSSGATDKLGDTVAKIVDLQTEINADIDTLVDLKREIMSVIDRLEAPFCDLLYKRYFQFLKWEEIAVGMNCSFRHVIRMHGTALKMVEHVLECPIKPVV